MDASQGTKFGEQGALSMLAHTLERYGLILRRKGTTKPQVWCVHVKTGRKFMPWKTQEEAVAWAIRVLESESA